MSVSDNSVSSADKPIMNASEVKRIALVIGVNNSIIQNSRNDLQHAEQDASDMAWILGEPPCEFERVETLRGKEAETRDVQKAIIRLIEGRNDRDFLLFYFSGHAQPMEMPGGHKDIYLVTHDFKESDVKWSQEMHLSLRWLRDKLYQQTKAGAVLLILDCCYAGNIIHTEADPYHIDLGKLFEDWLETPGTSKVQQDRQRATLTATGYNITAQEKNGHGLMTHWLLHALRGEDSKALDDNGQTDIHLLHKYLKKKIPEQCPNLAGEFGQYPWILASYPNQSTRFHQQAREAEVNELRNEILRVNEISNMLITTADHFEKLSAINTKPYTQPFDHIICEETSSDDLDHEKVNEFFKLDRVQRQEDFCPGFSDQDQLLHLGLLRKSSLTYGALLCLGKAPTKWLNGAFTRCIYWKGQDRHSGWTDDQEYRGNLIYQYESSCNFLKRCLHLNRIIGRDGSIEQWEIPFRVLEESLANALIHREYANPNNFVHRADHVCLDVFSDRIEISSPGGPPPPMTLEMLGIENESHPRNPQVVRIFYLNGYVEKVGSGIQRMQQLMKEAGLLPPKLQLSKTETFKVILYRPQQAVEEPIEYTLEERRENQKELIEHNTVISDAFPFVFVSHTPADSGFVNRLEADLHAQGISIWIDSKEIQPGMQWEETIRAAIRASHVVLLIVSPEARTSRHIRDELRIAKLYQRPVYPIWVRGTAWMESIPPGWDGIQYIDAHEEHYETAIQTIEKMLRTTILFPPVAPPPIPTFEPRNPYKGLRAFTSRDTQDFFGRSALVNELTHILETSLVAEKESSQGVRLLALVGASGSGKSSVVMAGLLPHLQNDGLPGSKEWVYLEPITPGAHPIESLALALSNQIPEKSLNVILEDLKGDSTRGLHLYASYLVKQQRRYVVVVVDQFEEVFTLTESEQERQQFLNLLTTACTQKDGPLIVILTLRADFYDRLMEYPTLYTHIVDHQIPMLPMVLSDLRAVITQPASLPDVQLTFEGNLVGDMLFDIQGQIGALPLLQFTLEQLFVRCEGHLLTEQAYQEVGGVKGALARHTEETYQTLPSEEHRQFARTVFLRLLDLGMTEQATMRRRAEHTEFVFADVRQTCLMQETLNAFVNARLLTTTANEMTGITMIEVSHEALIREWPRLVSWLHEARDDIRLQQNISKDTAAWEQHKHAGDYLYPGKRLKEAQAWAKRNTASKQEQVFLKASEARHFRSLLTIMGVILLVLTLSGVAGWYTFFQPKPTLVTTSLDDSNKIGSLRWCIDNAPSGSTIRFAQNVGKLIELTGGDLVVGGGKQLTIIGPGANQLTISGGNLNTHIHVFKGATLSISDLSFKNSETVVNGFLDNEGNLTVTNSVISNNKTTANFTQLGVLISSGAGGGVVNSGTLAVINSTISGNRVTTGWGGGIYNSGALILTNSTVSDNMADEGGGGIVNYGGPLILTNNSIVSDNKALGDPTKAFDGGIANTLNGKLTLIDSTISGNTASGSNGGIGSDGTLILINSTISGNTASTYGGGIGSTGPLTLINSTISGNTASTYGGGIFIAQADLTFSTIYGNRASVGSDIAVQDDVSTTQLSKVKISNSIVVGDPHRPDISGTLGSFGYNLFQNSSGATFDVATRERHRTDKTLSVNDLDKLFAAPVELRNNGGPTMTYMLGSSSPAIGAIPLQSCQIQDILNKQSLMYTDQRGMKRPGGSKQLCDIGAYESQVSS